MMKSIPNWYRNSAAALLMTATVVGGCSAQTDSPDVLIERGNIMFDRGHFEDAVLMYTEAITHVKDRPEVFFRRADCYKLLGLFDKALDDYDSCLRLSPDHVKAINDKGVVLAETGRYKAAAAEFSRIIEVQPGDARAYRNRGLCKYDMGQFAEAETDYNAAIEHNPGDQDAWYQRGNVLMQLNRLEEAIDDYTEAINIDPDFAKAWMNRGVARFRMGERAAAMAELQHAAEIDVNIIIPDIGWIDGGGDASEIVLAARPAQLLPSERQHACETFAMDYLTTHGYTNLRKGDSPAGCACTVFHSEASENPVNIFVGVVSSNDATRVQIPTPSRENTANALLVLKWEAATETGQPEVSVIRFEPDWLCDSADVRPLLVEIPVPVSDDQD